jgi:hypothetical protein
MGDATLTMTDLGPGPPAARFDPLTISIHWATLLLIVAMFVSAWMFGGATDSASAGRLLLLHRSTGVTIWLLTLLRLGWKVTWGRSPALPDTVGPLQRPRRARERILSLRSPRPAADHGLPAKHPSWKAVSAAVVFLPGHRAARPRLDEDLSRGPRAWRLGAPGLDCPSRQRSPFPPLCAQGRSLARDAARPRAAPRAGG